MHYMSTLRLRALCPFCPNWPVVLTGGEKVNALEALRTLHLCLTVLRKRDITKHTKSPSR